MSSFTADPEHEAIRLRTFTRRQFIEYEAAMRGEAPTGEYAQTDLADDDLDQQMTWSDWLAGP